MKYSFIKLTTILLTLSVVFISDCHRKNRPPHTPYTPSGPSVGSINKKYNFSSLAIDPDGDDITMRFDWGNGDTSAWLSDIAEIWFASEQTVRRSHSWVSLDTFYIRAQAKDKKENVSEWSMPHCFVTTLNHPPDIPLISGPTSGYIQTSYQFSGLAVDPDCDSVKIRFDWGDGNISDWGKWNPSGDSVWVSFSWLYPGKYLVRAQAKDSLGDTSEWSSPVQTGIR